VLYLSVIGTLAPEFLISLPITYGSARRCARMQTSA